MKVFFLTLMLARLVVAEPSLAAESNMMPVVSNPSRASALLQPQAKTQAKTSVSLIG